MGMIPLVGWHPTAWPGLCRAGPSALWSNLMSFLLSDLLASPVITVLLLHRASTQLVLGVGDGVCLLNESRKLLFYPTRPLNGMECCECESLGNNKSWTCFNYSIWNVVLNGLMEGEFWEITIIIMWPSIHVRIYSLLAHFLPLFLWV